ncbi:biotin carboxyl carrier protein [Flavobacterium saliperosum S13]|uniref:Biotin-requiring enzyme n=2 Tax=Flavobacterium saliperosum TaxID=329186 RepID=A0A1G4VRI3_9FLAO|nr:acetyl-CoA carboxylase biotin carboxyl carrier protein subunit [Flavobacterium saliperosum]ESU24081.1 biotin carboxyl carrier protein [Flavobacterium saliperosum S13]SCX10835.1 Biotin-requiring enzyme [Flavobacterium saliperosum]
MSTTYKVTVNTSTHFDVVDSDVSSLDAVSLGDSKFHILKDNVSYKAEITAADFNAKKYTVKMNNTTYVVDIANPLDQLIKEMGFAVGASKQINSIKAPMPGLILEISVAVGQEVKENDPILILGAMKMENSFLSPRDGVIKLIAVTQNQAVDKGQLLIEFE